MRQGGYPPSVDRAARWIWISNRNTKKTNPPMRLEEVKIWVEATLAAFQAR